MMKLGRLKKNLERSKIDNVARSFFAFEALSSTGRKIWLAFCPPSRMETIIEKELWKQWKLTFEVVPQWLRTVVSSVSQYTGSHIFMQTCFNETELATRIDIKGMHTFNRCFHRSKLVKLVFHQYPNSLCTSFNGILEVSNACHKIVICRVRMHNREIGSRVKFFWCYEDGCSCSGRRPKKKNSMWYYTVKCGARTSFHVHFLDTVFSKL